MRRNNVPLIVVLAWLVMYECMGAACYGVHAGWLGGLSIGSGPISVMVIEESSEKDRLSPGQLDIIGSHTDGSLRKYLEKHGEPDPLRVVDKDDAMSQDTEKWQKMFAAKGATVPWLVIGRGGRVLLSEALPKSEEEAMRAVKRYGGN